MTSPISLPPVSTPYESEPPPPNGQPAASLEHLLLRFGLVSLDQLSAALREQLEQGTPITESLVRDGVVRAEDIARVTEHLNAHPAPAPETSEAAPAAPEPVAAEPVPVPVPLPPSAVEPVLEPPSFERPSVERPAFEAAAVPVPVVDPMVDAMVEPVVEPAALSVEPPVAEPPLSEPPLPEPPLPEPPVLEPPVLEPPLSEPPPSSPPLPPAAEAPPPASVPEPPSAQPPVAQAPAAFVVRGRLVNGEEVEIAVVGDGDEAQQIGRDAMLACARPDGAEWPVIAGRYVRPDAIVSIEVAER